MKISKVNIKNFKIFRNEKIELDKFNVLVGDNGTGKSTLIEAIHLALTGFYRGKNVMANLSQDLFNKSIVDEFLKKLETIDAVDKPEPPKIVIEIFFDDFPFFNGDYNSTKSSADGFTFEIKYDDRNDDAYKALIINKSLTSLPIEFYKCEWTTFSRKTYTNSKNIVFKSAYLDTKLNKFGDFFSERLIKNYLDDQTKIELNQKFRETVDSLKSLNMFKNINDKISLCEDLNKRNISIGIVNSSQNSWTNVIDIKENGIPYENIGTGKQCIVNTIFSFENDLFKNKGIILIEEPENHLSGMNLNILLEYIKRNIDNFQILITTHSSFVLNKLGMNNLLLINNKKILKFNELPAETSHYFEKVSGFDTLRYILCKKAILVEGDSDDLVIQRAYLDLYNKLPIEAGIEIIAVSLAFSRFLDLSCQLNIKTVVVTDNDGDMERVNKIRDKYKQFPFIKIITPNKIFNHAEMGVDKNRVTNVNTLEPEILRANNLETINRVLDKKFDTAEDLLHYMLTNKTETAWKIFNSHEKINYPDYIKEAIKSE